MHSGQKSIFSGTLHYLLSLLKCMPLRRRRLKFLNSHLILPRVNPLTQISRPHFRPLYLVECRVATMNQRHLDCIQRKGTKPYQVFPNLTWQFNVLQENARADSFENVKEFACEKLNCPLEFGKSQLVYFLSA